MLREATMEKNVPGNQPISKRNFLIGLIVIVTSYMVALFWSTIKFLTPTVSYDPPASFKAGYIDDYVIDTFSDRWLEKHKNWIQRKKDGLVAIVAVCTHLGCVPKLMMDENRIMCSCHGTAFTMEGDVISGPAPVPLYRAAITLADDGQIIVDKTVKENRPDFRGKEPYILKT